MRSTGRALTAQVIEEEVRFVLKTLMRDDLFGDAVSLTEAEKLLETSLTVPFVEYCAILPRLGAIAVDRGRNVVAVNPRGRDIARGASDPDFVAALVSHFAGRIESPKRSSSSSSSSAGAPSASSSSSTHAPVIPTRPDAIRPEPTRVPSSEGGFARPPVTVVLDGRYVRGKKIGEGSLGTAYLASDETLGRTVVEKILDHVFSFVTYVPASELAAKLRSAILAQARLEHPAILPILDVDFDVTPPRVVASLAPGGSLAARLAHAAQSSKSRALPPELALGVVVQIAHGLAHAHGHGLVHGGLKPENVLFDARGNVRLSDFGLARATEKPQGSSVPVYVGAGAPSYMAPEQLHKGELTPAVDVYAAGILLYEMLTGELPGRRSPMPSKVVKGLAASVDDLFDEMTRDRADERPKDGAALLARLAALVPEHARDAGILAITEKDPFPLSEKIDGPSEPTVVEELVSAEAEPIKTGEG